jgi:hypothetical protein
VKARAAAEIRKLIKNHGIYEACAMAEATPATVYDWERKGWVRLAVAALEWAKALEPDDAVKQLKMARKLAGLE